MTRFNLLQQDFLAEKPITLPILDSGCLSFFFESDDRLFKKLDNISSITFLYVSENEGYCPTINCTVNYTYEYMCSNINNIPSDNKYFIYDEIDDAICLSIHENKMINFCKYIDTWISNKYQLNISIGEKGLKISTLLKFIKDIGCMGLYLEPYEDIIVGLEERFVIADKRFT